MRQDGSAETEASIVVHASRVQSIATSLLFLPFGIVLGWELLMSETLLVEGWGLAFAGIVTAFMIFSGAFSLWHALLPPRLVVDLSGIRIEAGLWWTDVPLPWRDVNEIRVGLLYQLFEAMEIRHVRSRHALMIIGWQMSPYKLKQRIDAFRTGNDIG